MTTNDRVAYSVQFLRSIGMEHSEQAHIRGTITSITKLGNSELALVNWDGGDIRFPAKINVKNLAIIGPNRKFCNVD